MRVGVDVIGSEAGVDVALIAGIQDIELQSERACGVRDFVCLRPGCQGRGIGGALLATLAGSIPELVEEALPLDRSKYPRVRVVDLTPPIATAT